MPKEKEGSEERHEREDPDVPLEDEGDSELESASTGWKSFWAGVAKKKGKRKKD